ncbi:hypothetical protein MAPG_11141 [Magnaporthiopsis poae ATCC 64411]|uniref:Uncharacterized protein n=1 Tax=Magnaporthiopsis poae (strain ATCC 64411 / 73-15) TaxID=644358 RepID=A0A0C4EEG8_MAGP6|nr:hypothetical protein MAPG_11141 [Magnaporthiopsis poae ATCC 64411]
MPRGRRVPPILVIIRRAGVDPERRRIRGHVRVLGGLAVSKPLEVDKMELVPSSFLACDGGQLNDGTLVNVLLATSVVLIMAHHHTKLSDGGPRCIAGKSTEVNARERRGQRMYVAEALSDSAFIMSQLTSEV